MITESLAITNIYKKRNKLYLNPVSKFDSYA